MVGGFRDARGGRDEGRMRGIGGRDGGVRGAAGMTGMIGMIRRDDRVRGGGAGLQGR